MVKYIWVRIRREDFEKIVRTKKIPMEHEIKSIIGKDVSIKNTQLFKIAANSTWDLGSDYKNKIIKAVRFKKGGFKL